MGLELTLQEIEEMPKRKYKQLIKIKVKDHAFKYLMEKKVTGNGKGKEIKYKELKMQNYLQTEDLEINSYERKVIFQLRTKMHFKTKNHFRNMHEDSICDGCRK